MPRYLIIYKPYGVISQFTPEVAGQVTLADVFDLPPGVYPVGRLDHDSEGLLLLTDDPRINHRLLDPAFAHPRTYWVQVEGAPDPDAAATLRTGVDIHIKGKSWRTRPAQVSIFEVPPLLPPRIPPVRFRKTVPDHWLEITLTEGKNRQVRRMCAAVGLPVLRLVRVGIGNIRGEMLQPGALHELTRADVQALLGI
jgi:23S rRNA pseudouridine2457 synthase